MPGVSEQNPSEFVFCDMNGGAWGCEKTTPKTPISYVPVSGNDDKQITNIVKGAIKGIVNGSALSSENVVNREAPNTKPTEIVFFDFDSSVLNAKSKITLLNILPQLSGKKVLVHGYTDSVGNEYYNDKLSLNRAESVREFFIKAKSKAAEIETFANGLCCYLEQNRTKEQRAKNRRVEVFVVD